MQCSSILKCTCKSASFQLHVYVCVRYVEQLGNEFFTGTVSLDCFQSQFVRRLSCVSDEFLAACFLVDSSIICSLLNGLNCFETQREYCINYNLLTNKFTCTADTLLMRIFRSTTIFGKLNYPQHCRKYLVEYFFQCGKDHHILYVIISIG